MFWKTLDPSSGGDFAPSGSLPPGVCLGWEVGGEISLALQLVSTQRLMCVFLGNSVKEPTRVLRSGPYTPEAWVSGGSRAVLMGLPLGRTSAGEREWRKQDQLLVYILLENSGHLSGIRSMASLRSCFGLILLD